MAERLAQHLRSLGLASIVMGATGATILACGHSDGVGVSSDSDLVGGRLATAGEFPSTMMIGDSCTAAKVGPRHILTAAHCVMRYDAPGSPTSLYASGATLHLTSELAADNHDVLGPAFTPVVIERTHVNPTYVREQLSGGNLGPNPSADVAIVALTIESAAALSSIPSARIDPQPVVPSDKLVVMGYGCETGVYAGFDYAQARLKVQATTALEPTDALQSGRFPAPDPSARTADNYFFTPGAALQPDAASLCPGDSGGPVYRDDGTGKVIVGVNAYYNFASARPDVSLTNWHTRLDEQAAEGIHDWVRSVLNGEGPDPAIDDAGTDADASP